MYFPYFVEFARNWWIESQCIAQNLPDFSSVVKGGHTRINTLSGQYFAHVVLLGLKYAKSQSATA